MKRALVVCTAFVMALILGAAPQNLWAIPLSETRIIIEVNATDGDAGIQIFLDGVGWDSMEVFGPDGNEILVVGGEGSVGIQGITELFLESAEPSFDEQPLAELLALFLEGTYRFEGETTDGKKLKGRAMLTHAIPDGPALVSPVEDDDSVDPADTVVEWMLVADPPGSEIVGYQVIVEREKPTLRVFSVNLGPTATSVTVPPEFLEPGTAYKFEVLAIEASGNQTISEREFETAE